MRNVTNKEKKLGKKKIPNEIYEKKEIFIAICVLKSLPLIYSDKTEYLVVVVLR